MNVAVMRMFMGVCRPLELLRHIFNMSFLMIMTMTMTIVIAIAIVILVSMIVVVVTMVSILGTTFHISVTHAFFDTVSVFIGVVC